MVGEAFGHTLWPGDETFLVRLDRQANDLRRDLQVIFLECAHQHMRPFHEAGHFFQKTLVFDQIETVGKGEILRVVQDHVLAALGIQHDLRLFEARHVIVEATNGNGLRCMEAVTIGHVGGRDAIHFERNDLCFVVFRPEHADDGLQRSHPAQAFRTLAVNAVEPHALGRGGGTGAHALRPGEGADDAGHDIGNDLFRRTTGLGNHCHVEIALLRVRSDLRLFHGAKTCLAQEALNGLFRRLGGWTLDLFPLVGGTGCQTTDIQRQAARRPVFARSLIGQTGFHQRIGHELLQIARSLALHAGRNFLGAEF